MARRISITTAGDLLAVRTPYNSAFVADLKSAVPFPERRWDGARKVWLVATRHGPLLLDLIEQHYGVRPDLPAAPAATAGPAQAEKVVFNVHYLGRCRERHGFDEPLASGCLGGPTSGRWEVLFPESVLRAYFERAGTQDSYFATLGLPLDADNEAIRRAYRRLARQWHPDVCKEPDAKERFLAIKEAYDALSDPAKRARYLSALKLLRHEDDSSWRFGRDRYGYRAPMTCGRVYALARRLPGGLYLVERIVKWDDLRDEQGRTLVSSWPRGGDRFVERWIADNGGTS